MSKPPAKAKPAKARTPRPAAAQKRAPGKKAGRPPTKKSGSAGVLEAGLTDEHRVEIVTRLAMYDTVAAIHADLQARGIDISNQAVAYYNAEFTGERLGQRWVNLFQATRDAFTSELARVPIAHRAYRLRKLDSILTTELARGNTVGARATLEQAAKEVGDVFTNVTKATGKVDHAHLVAHTTLDEKRNMLADRLREGMLKVAKVLPAPDPA